MQTEAPQSPELEAMVSTAKNELTRFANTSSRVAQETVDSILAIEDPDELADVIAANTLNKLKDRQSILETIPPFERLEKLSVLLESAIEIAELETKLQYKIHEAVEKNQKDYYLREQIRIYQKELGDTEFSDAEELRKKLAETPLNDEAREKCAKEIDRLSHMATGTPEITTSLSYIEWLLEMPWGKYTQDNLDLGRARQILSENHYGLEKVKERIIEYLAVLQVKKDMKGPILCFVGPPGVGKTSVVRAIAKAIDRKFIHAVGIEELFKVQREHADFANAAHGDRSRLRERYTKKRAAGDVSKAVIVPKEFQHGQKVRIGLNLVKEDQCILFLLHFISGDHTDPEIKIIHGGGVGKELVADGVFQHIDFNKIGKQLLPYITNNVGLSDLTSAVNEQNTLRVGLPVLFNYVRNLSLQHG